MTVEPVDWNVVVVGHWNAAILTPNGIAKRLLKVPEGTGIEVFIPIDLLGAPKVRYEDVTIQLSGQRLIVGTEKPDYQTLNKAAQTARNALCSLPETPVLAAGLNIRFKLNNHPIDLDKIVDSVIDVKLSDAGYELISRGLTRTIRLKGGPFTKGVLNFSAVKDEKGVVKIELNFHRDSKSTKELADWLNLSKESLEKEVTDTLSKIVPPILEEMNHAGDS
jgi:hypothetical protein